jgi:hypothetical protein
MKFLSLSVISEHAGPAHFFVHKEGNSAMLRVIEEVDGILPTETIIMHKELVGRRAT